MPEGEKTKLHLEIAHILFVDIVGYSKLLVDEQHEQLQQLNEIVRATEQFRNAEAKSELIRLPTGDGMALVFLTNPEAPVECAMEIAKALKGFPEISLRMGIHSGPVNQVSDVNERSNVAGAGINMAQRVMDCGDAGHILLSKRSADDLSQYRQWQPLLHDLGECDIKHGGKVSVVNLYADGIGNAAIPAKFKGAGESPQPSVSHQWSGRKWALIAAALLIIAALAFVFLRSKPHAISASSDSQPMVAASTFPEKSIAVLPFEI